MEVITRNSGLHHISEDILQLVDIDSLMNCRLVNSSWKEILDQPIFWLKKMYLVNSIIFDIEIIHNPSFTQELDDQVQVYVKDNSTIFDVQKKWKNLAQQIDNIQVCKEFVIILIKGPIIYYLMANLRPKNLNRIFFN